MLCLTGVSPTGSELSLDLGAVARAMVLGNKAMFGSVNANRRHYDAGAAALMQADRSWLGRLVSRKVPLERFSEAFEGETGRRQGGPRGRLLSAGGPLVRPLAEGVVEIDTLLGGWERTTAGYLLTGDAPVLVETGSQSSVPVLLEALESLGLGPSDLAGIALTHIHLDHAGGPATWPRAFPGATIYVHELGARHLVDPSRLVASAGRVYGDLLDSLYGRLTPSPADRVQVLGDGETVELGGGRRLVAVDSPGHAKHHLGFHDEGSGLLFAGDAVGVRLPDGGVLRPATPPPDFDLDLALSSLERFGARRPAGIALAHYGLVPDPRGGPAGRGGRHLAGLGRRGGAGAGGRGGRGRRARGALWRPTCPRWRPRRARSSRP